MKKFFVHYCLTLLTILAISCSKPTNIPANVTLAAEQQRAGEKAALFGPHPCDGYMPMS